MPVFENTCIWNVTDGYLRKLQVVQLTKTESWRSLDGRQMSVVSWLMVLLLGSVKTIRVIKCLKNYLIRFDSRKRKVAPITCIKTSITTHAASLTTVAPSFKLWVLPWWHLFPHSSCVVIATTVVPLTQYTSRNSLFLSINLQLLVIHYQRKM